MQIIILYNVSVRRWKVTGVCIFGRVVGGIIVCFLFWFVAFCFCYQDEGSIPVLLALLVVVIAIEVVEALVSMNAIKLELNEKRISGKRGVFNVIELDSPIDKITQVRVEHTLFGKIFDYGNIEITTASATFKFNNIKDADGFRDEVLKLMDKNDNN